MSLTFTILVHIKIEIFPNTCSHKDMNEIRLNSPNVTCMLLSASSLSWVLQ